MRKPPKIFAFSPDAKLLAVIVKSRDTQHFSSINIRDLATWRFIQRPRGHEQPVVVITFSPRTQFLAVASWDHTIGLWSMSSLACVRTLSGHFDRVTTIKFSLDEKIMATGSIDKTVQVWEIATGMLLQVVRYGAGFIRDISFSNDEFVVSVSDDDLNSLCDVLSRNVWNETVWNKAPILKDYTYPITATQETATLEAALRRKVSLSSDRSWLIKGCEKIIWLPGEYQPTGMESWARRESTLFIACASRRVYRLQVS